MADARERTFLVESYVPQLDMETAATITSRYRTAVHQLEEEGLALRWVRSFALLDEETYLCIVVARDLDHVVRLNERACLENGHVAEALAMDSPTAG